MIPQPSKW